MELKELIEKVGKLKELVKVLTDQKTAIENQIKTTNEELEPLVAELLKALNEQKKDSIESEGWVAYKGTTSATGYADEFGVINYLKENGYPQYVNVKESLNKKELNKELKTNASLKEALNSMITTSHTEWATVVTSENYSKVLEHINESKKGK